MGALSEMKLILSVVENFQYMELGIYELLKLIMALLVADLSRFLAFGCGNENWVVVPYEGMHRRDHLHSQKKSERACPKHQTGEILQACYLDS